MKRAGFAVPGDLATPTGGYTYDRRVIAELKRMEWQIEIVNLGDGFPWPNPEVRRRAVEKLHALSPGLPTIIDGLAFGALPELAAEFCATHRVIALVHHPLALETGLSPEQADTLRARERTALSGARRVVAVSPMVAAMLVSDYGVAGEIITVACPGNDPMRRARGSRDKTTNLLSVGAVVPRKGYDVLVAALSKIADLPWRLAIAGDCGRDAATTAALRSQIARSNLAHRITLAGAVSDAALAALYVGADVFVLPSRFEGYGMAFTEAIACGLPVIGTTSGAVPQTIPAGAGILVPPDDVAALADALRRVIEDAKLRMDFAAAAGRAAEQLPTWKAAARRIAAVLETVA